MKKSNNILLLLLAVALILSLPFLNGVGCDAMIHVGPLPTGQLYGRCEHGKVHFTVRNNETQEIYKAQGYYGFLNGQYYIVFIDRTMLVENDDEELPTSNYFYRDVYSGLVVTGKGGGRYLLSSSPVPIMWKAKISGKLGFFDFTVSEYQ